MVLVKMLMRMMISTMIGVLVMMNAWISPSRREVSPAESLRRRAKVLLPWFRLETAAESPKSVLLIFSRVKASYRRTASAVDLCGPHKPGWRALGGGRAPRSCGPIKSLVRYFFLPVFFIYSKINLHKISLHFELRRIYISAVAFPGQNSSYR